MPRNKKNTSRRKNESSVLLVNKYIIVSALFVILGAFFIKLETPLISNTAKSILGTNSHLARGGDDGEDNSGSGSTGYDSESNDHKGQDDDSKSGSSDSSVTNIFKVESSDDDDETNHDEFEDHEEDEINHDEGDHEHEDNEEELRIKQEEEEIGIRLSESERIRARTKDGRTRIDITSEGIRTRFEYRDDRVIIKAELEDGTEDELEDDTIFKIEERLGISGIKVSTASGQRFVVARNNAGAITDYVLLIDLATNALLVNAPSGQKEVAILPDTAIRNALAANAINQLVLSDKFDPESVTSIDSVIELGEINGNLVYEVAGISNQKLLGFLPVLIEKTITVSAVTGDVESTSSPIFDRILDFISL